MTLGFLRGLQRFFLGTIFAFLSLQLPVCAIEGSHATAHAGKPLLTALGGNPVAASHRHKVLQRTLAFSGLGTPPGRRRLLLRREFTCQRKAPSQLGGLHGVAGDNGVVGRDR